VVKISFFLVLALSLPAHASPQDIELGKRIYREGVLPSGTLLTAQARNGVVLRGAQAACVNCHRRSGLGSSEGGKVVRPIAGAMLYHAPAAAGLRAPSRGLSGRTLYTDALLAKAVREGVDASGRVLDLLMPRYALNDDDTRALVTYLKSLSSDPSPGATQDSIHFATIITPGVAPEKRKAMLDVLHAFFRDKNAGTRHETRRSAHAPWDMAREYQAYRKWVLHVWELNGAADTWPAQLESFYRKQPVFAMLSGIGAGSWQPVHEFCERKELPCLFPNTHLPEIDEQDFYPVYFTQGMTLEAQALATHLQSAAGQVVQVYRAGDPGAVAAAALRQALPGRVTDRRVEQGERLTAAFWNALQQQAQSSALVVWLSDDDMQTFNHASSAQPEAIYLSSSLAAKGKAPTLGDFQAHLYFVRPFDLPQALDRRLVRFRTWLRARGIDPGDEQIQANTYFAATVAGDALMHLIDNFHRDYFMERLEGMLDNSFAGSIYPRLSLGAGQRFASKGAYVVKYMQEPTPGLQPVGGWIVP